ncbi:MAG TPA: toluene hydroxylase [Bacillales bacterium]|nr:toluene hydroxylase [Bacillales bacterium]
MSADQISQIKPIREKPFTWDTKNEYEEVTLRMQTYMHYHYRNIFDERDYDLYDPRYTRIKSSDWEAFRDPKRYWYTTYTRDRKNLAIEVENGFKNAQELGIIENLPIQWVDALRDIYTPLRHIEYGENVQMQHVIRYALGTPIEQCATFQAYDKTGRAQWITLWAMNMQEHHGNFLDRSKEILLNEPAYQPLRSYAEELLVTNDWAEVILAENLTLDLLLGNLMYKHLTKEAGKFNDYHLSVLNLTINKQMKWQSDWAFALFKHFANDKPTSRWDYLKSLGYEDWPGDYRWGRTLTDPRETPEEELSNIEIIQEWVEKWYPKAYQAVLALAPLFEKHNLSMDLEKTLKQIEEEDFIPLYKKAGIPFNCAVSAI